VSQLFGRSWKVQVDTLDVSALDLEFDILKSIKPTPNKCSLTIWDLNRDHRAQLLRRNKPNPASNNIIGIPVQVQAGYRDNAPMLFQGDLREVGGGKDVADRKITLSGDDGGRAYREARISKTFTKGTPLSTICQQACSAMGIGQGNSARFFSGVSIEASGNALPHTMTLSGSAAEQLTRVLSSVKLTWSIQNGALQILPNGTPLDQEAIEVSSSTGLLDSPQASIDSTTSLGSAQQFAAGVKQKNAKPPKPKATSVLKVRTLIIPGWVPGRKIVLKSDEYNGGYMIMEARYRGQTWSKDYFIESIVRVY
jgi:hypothetical protein